MGQCSKIVHSSEPYKSRGMSTKKVFDDMYLYLKEIFLKSTANRHMDPMNGMPKKEDYAQVASEYWNNIYKEPSTAASVEMPKVHTNWMMDNIKESSRNQNMATELLTASRDSQQSF